LTDQIGIISDSIELYCGRSFIAAVSTQSFYEDDFTEEKQISKLSLANYPVDSISSFIQADTSAAFTDYRLHKPTGKLTATDYHTFFENSEELTIVYTAGYSTATLAMPSPVKSVVYSLVEERYNKKTQGVALNFGSDIQSVSIPGTISISYDYTLQGNERNNFQGMLLGNYANVLDIFRTDKALMDRPEDEYIA
jgi:hypothetical protein